MMLWATMLAGTDLVLHAAGWLEGGLTASFEKFALDVELLRHVQPPAEGIGFSERGARVRRHRRRWAPAGCSWPRSTRWSISRSGCT